MEENVANRVTVSADFAGNSPAEKITDFADSRKTTKELRGKKEARTEKRRVW
jgi:hypothetical protein